MAKDRDRDIEIDPRFFVPNGVVDVRQENKEDGEYYYNEKTLAAEGPTLQSPESVLPMPSSSFEIVEQRVRIAPDGRAVVDVIVEFPDAVFKVDVRVTTV